MFRMKGGGMQVGILINGFSVERSSKKSTLYLHNGVNKVLHGLVEVTSVWIKAIEIL